MSLVHDNLRREERQGREPAVGDSLPPVASSEAPPVATDDAQEFQRKQQRLVDGIGKLQTAVAELGRQLDEAHAENQRLRELVRAQAGVATDPDAPKPKSLISQAME